MRRNPLDPGVLLPTRGWIAGLALPAFLVLSSPAAAHTLEAGAGIRTGFDSDFRSVFGTVSVLSFGYQAPISTGGARILVEIGYASGSGQTFRSNDPTFEVPESDFWVVPLVLGISTNAIPEEKRETVGVHLGVGIVNLLTGFTNHLGDGYHSPAFGFMAEIRPEVRLGKRWGLWVRERISVVTDVDYDFSGPSEFNYSGADLQIGLMADL